MTNRKDIDLTQGDTYSCMITFPYDITGITFRFAAIRDKEDPSNELAIEYTTLAGSDPNDDPSNGIVNLRVGPEHTSNLKSGEYDYRLSKIVTNGLEVDPTTLLTGKINVETKV